MLAVIEDGIATAADGDMLMPSWRLALLEEEQVTCY